MKKLLAVIIVLAPILCFAQTVSDYLILENIFEYRLSTPEKLIPGFAPIGGPRVIDSAGVVAGAGHFYFDHKDKTYRTSYFDVATRTGAEVQITQHSGSDADEWLLHEIEDSYRDGDDEDGRLGLLADGTILREFGTNRTFWLGIGGGHFRWLSNYVVIDISYTDLDGTKPEPLEIIQAYLQKFPSTLPADLVLDSNHDKTWIKDEMTRRLWLCDKWLIYSQTGRVERTDLVRELVDHLTVFLQYREKYYGIAAESDLVFLDDCMQTNNQPKIEKKVAEYKAWWAANKNKPITLP